MSTLYIRLPSKAVAGNAPEWPALACQFALTSHGSSIERQGAAVLPDLAQVVAESQRVVLLLAASDVTVLRMQVPPLSAARLKTALPNLVEEKLLADPADCVVVTGMLSDGLRTIAVVQRAWLAMLSNTLHALGARHVSALPAQLCLPLADEQPGGVTAVIDDRNDMIDMTLRLSEQDGIGLAISPGLTRAEGPEQNAAAVQEVIKTILAVVPEAPVILYVPQSRVGAYQEIVNGSGDQNKVSLGKRISVSADNWSRWIAGANAMKLDLMAGLGNAPGAKVDWRPWRWPLALAVAVLLINAAALNIDWWHMQREANSLRASMIQIYKAAYPGETVILDPIAQMQQKVAIARHASGMAAPDDFTALTAAFGEAWAVTATGKNATIAALDYHDRSLYVHLKQGSESPIGPMRTALSKHQLALDPAPEQSGAVVWQIRGMR